MFGSPPQGSAKNGSTLGYYPRPFQGLTCRSVIGIEAVPGDGICSSASPPTDDYRVDSFLPPGVRAEKAQ